MATTGCGLHEEDFDLEPQQAHTSSNNTCGNSIGSGVNGTCNNHQAGGCGGGGSCTNSQKSDVVTANRANRPQGSWARAAITLGETAGTGSQPVTSIQPAKCLKCKEKAAVVSVRHGEPFCAACLDDAVMWKLRYSKGKGAFLPREKVLVAISGGCGSLGLLSGLMSMQSKNPDRPEKGKVVLEILPVYIQEGAAWGVSDAECQAHEQQLAAAVQATACPEPLQVLPLSLSLAVTSNQHLNTDSNTSTRDVLERELVKLIQAVDDLTGKEDLVTYLRTALLHAIARQHGCTKIMMGDCADTLAIRVISATTKGRGYSLPAEVALSDARHGPGSAAVVQPLRDVTAKELAWFCRGRQIPAPVVLPVLPPPLEQAKHSMNQLSEGFVTSLQANLPSIMFTILRTASALQPFPFNEPDVANYISGSFEASAAKTPHHKSGSSPISAATKARLEQQAEKSKSYQLCSLCSAPLASEDVQGQHQGPQDGSTNDTESKEEESTQQNRNLMEDLKASCCHCCKVSIIGSLVKKGVGLASGSTGLDADGVSTNNQTVVLPSYVAQRLETMRI